MPSKRVTTVPKYVERDKVRPIPGAYGLERSKVEWERRNRRNAQYLTQTGYYADKLYIYADIEYGYAAYLWIYPGSPKELVDDYVANRVPWTLNKFKGECDPVAFRTPQSERGKSFPRKLELILIETDQVIEGFNHISHFDGEVLRLDRGRCATDLAGRRVQREPSGQVRRI